MSSKPRHGDSIATTHGGEKVYLEPQMQAFIDNIDIDIESHKEEINIIKSRLEALENA